MKRFFVLFAGLLLKSFFAVSAQVPPSLSIQSTGPQTLRITWPNTAIGFELEQSSVLPNGAIWQSVNQTPLDQNNQFSVLVNAAQGKQFFRLRVPPFTSIRDSSPVDGETGVAVIRETIVHFTAPLATNAVLTTSNFYAGYSGQRLLSRVELSADRKKATLFYLEPMPGSTRINAVFDGTGLTDELGRPLDVDGDGVPGGFTIISFDTLNLTPLTGTAVIGQVFASELLPGSDTGANAINRPLEGVTITVDGMEETMRAITDAQGNFTLAPAPPGRFFVKIDGHTAKGSQWPTNGAYYPYVGKAWDAVAGKTNNLAGGTGKIFLPLIAADTLQPVSMTADTMINFPTSVISNNPALAGVSIMVPANSLYSDNGTRGGKVGIAPVPPDRLPGPLPPGAELPLVITVQTDGPLNFDKPAPVCFPNLPNPTTGKAWPPGTKGSLISFNHKKGLWEAVGGMTVSADGQLFCTDPGIGILQPGWHGAQCPPPVEPPPPPRKTRTCQPTIDATEGCIGQCEFLDEECRNKAIIFTLASYQVCAALANNGFSEQAGDCYQALELKRSIAKTNCDLALVTCLGACKPCENPPVSADRVDAGDPLIRQRRIYSVSMPESNPVTEQIIGLIGQIDDLLQPFASNRLPIPTNILTQIEGLRHQADSLAGGDSPGYLKRSIIANEEYITATAAKSGLEPDDLIPGNAPPYPVLYVATVARPNGLFFLRGETAPFGQYSLFLPPDGTLLDVSFYDPKTKEFGFITPNLSPDAPFALPRFLLAPLPSDATDFDHDGLPDVVEDVYGTDPTNPDTDGDGIPDGTEVEQGTNPLDGLVVRTGVVATAKTPGAAIDVWAGSEGIITAEGAAGVSIFKPYDGSIPTIVAHVVTPGSAVRVACSGALAAVADASVGLVIIDFSSPTTAHIANQVSFAGAQSVAAGGGIGYVGLSSGSVFAVDLTSGELLDQTHPADSPIQDLALEGDYLYALTADHIYSISLRGAGFNVVGSALAPFSLAGNQRLFVGGGIAYTVHRKGYDTLDVSNPVQPVLLTAGNTTQFGWKQMVANGSGLGLAAVGPNSTDDGPHDISLYDLSNPRTNNVFLTTFPTPGIARAVAIYNGLAFVADDSAGLQVINYLPYDANKIPPAISLAASFGSAETEAGAPARVTALVGDDVQVRNVAFYLDGTNVFTDGSFPFEFRFIAPSLTATKTNFVLRALASDTGGNVTWSEELRVALLPDSTPPRVRNTAPFGGGKLVTAVLAYFNEPMDPATLNAASFKLVSAGPDGVLDTPDDVAVTGGDISYRADVQVASLIFSSPLSEKLYRAVVTSAAADLAGNHLAADHVWQFRVADAVFWKNNSSGSWEDPLNWTTGAVPGPNDDVIIDVPAPGAIITYASSTPIKSLVANARLQMNGGILQAPGGIRINSDLVLNGGTIKDATITETGAGKLVLANYAAGNALDHVTLNGDIDATASNSEARIRNGLALNGTIRIDHNSIMYFDGTQTLSSGTVEFVGDSGFLTLDGASTLTLGPGAVLHGRNGVIGGSIYFAGTGNLINQGLISADVAGGTVTIHADSFQNDSAGRMETKNGGAINITTTRWSNSGVIDGSGGAAVSLGGTWSNGGTIAYTNTTLNLGGAFSFATLGTLTGPGGTLNLASTLDLGGGTLALDAITGPWTLNGGTIRNGTITETGTGKLLIANNGGNVLDAVTLNGDLGVTTANSQLHIRNGLTLNGTIKIDRNSIVYFDGTQTLSTGTVEFVGDSGFLSLNGGSSLTLGPSALLHGKSGVIGGSVFLGGTGTLINQGLISTDVAGGTLTIHADNLSNEAGGRVEAKNGGALTITTTRWSNSGVIDENGGTALVLDGTWNNTGTIAFENTSLNLGGTFSLATLGTVNRTGGTVNLTTTLDLGGGTLALDAVTGPWTLNGGIIKNGTITETGAGTLIIADNGANVLDHVTMNGDLDLTIANSQLRVRNGLTLNGVLSIDRNSVVYFDGTQTLSTGTVEFPGDSGFLALDGGSNLTLGPAVVLHGKSGLVGVSLYFGGAGTLISQGLISADLPGGTLTIHTAQFDNRGTIAATAANSALVIKVNPFTNNGTVQELNGGKVLINP